MAIPSDMIFPKQWHLWNPGDGYDLNVTGIWGDYSGAGVRVAVIDDGFDYLHEDLEANYNQDLDYDFANSDFDAFGEDFSGDHDPHGTAVMGIIGADDNGVGTVGVAHDAELVGYRTWNRIGDESLAETRDAILRAVEHADADVINLSVGINDLSSTIFGNGLSSSLLGELEAAIDKAVATGRDGLGTTIVKSAGNSRNKDFSWEPDLYPVNYDTNADAWSRDTHQTVVAAVDRDGTVSEYSSFGASNLVAAFGSPFFGEVVTTDRRGDEGYNDTDYNFDFWGTSAAAPMVSGIVALMLEANEGLGWRDIQTILANSARHVGSAIDGFSTDGIEREPWQWNGADHWNGGGLHFSNDYGYGLVDAHAAVRLAESWHQIQGPQTSANETKSFETVFSGKYYPPGGDPAGKTFKAFETESLNVERVAVTMNFDAPRIEDLEVYLTSPGGTTSELIRDILEPNPLGGGMPFSYSGSWTFESQAFRGEESKGEWNVRVVDDTVGAQITVYDIELETFGAAPTVNDAYIFTDEYSDFAGHAGHRTRIADKNGGTDTVNAAAVTSDSIIHLDGTTSKIDGVRLALKNMENAIGGDGNDEIFGNASDNSIRGMRGEDQILGGAGDDTFRFDTGDGKDTIIDFAAGAGSDDAIDLRFHSAATSLVQMQDQGTIVQEELGAVIDFGGGDVLTLLDVKASHLHSDDFLF